MIDLSQFIRQLGDTFLAIPGATREIVARERPIGPTSDSRLALENFAAKWQVNVTRACVSAKLNCIECDNKRLKHFRRRFGPHFGIEDLPRAKASS